MRLAESQPSRVLAAEDAVGGNVEAFPRSPTSNLSPIRPATTGKNHLIQSCLVLAPAGCDVLEVEPLSFPFRQKQNSATARLPYRSCRRCSPLTIFAETGTF